MNREKVTYSMGATPFIYDILRELETNGGAVPTLKFYLCGGAPVPGYLVQRQNSMEYFSARFMDPRRACRTHFVRPDEALALNGTTSGRAMEGVEIRVVDEDGTT